MRGLTGTILWSLVAAGIGIGMYFIKHEVKEQEARLTELNSQIQRNQESIHVLKAEWSYLNDPARLRALAEKHLSMKAVGPKQVASLDQLPAMFARLEAGQSDMADSRRIAEPVTAAAKPAPGKAVPASVKVAAAAPAPAPVPAKPVVATAEKHVAPAALAAPVPAPVAVTAPPPPIRPVAAQPHIARPVAPPPQPARNPGRVIVIRSPALAASELSTSGEAR